MYANGGIPRDGVLSSLQDRKKKRRVGSSPHRRREEEEEEEEGAEYRSRTRAIVPVPPFSCFWCSILAFLGDRRGVVPDSAAAYPFCRRMALWSSYGSLSLACLLVRSFGGTTILACPHCSPVRVRSSNQGQSVASLAGGSISRRNCSSKTKEMRGAKQRSEIPTPELVREEVEEENVNEKSGFFACYLLCSLCPRYKGHTYIGFTINPRRRIRQHNGEIRCGAWRTKCKRPWEMILCIYGFPSKVSALQVSNFLTAQFWDFYLSKLQFSLIACGSY
ncbi:hypothetical protein Taro_031596 [Colocasia esculenta]|uniref:GIY-YIG domain-containing protein n=1 Tax=Colocasia esculenta TaxID=4460 RepID=A0A843VV25_COLES|nr:hypothetical protein [Colocasia esculenta]